MVKFLGATVDTGGTALSDAPNVPWNVVERAFSPNAPSVVQSFAGTTTVAGTTLNTSSPAAATTAGNYLLAFITTRGGATVSTVTDTASNVWSAIGTEATVGGLTATAYACLNAASISTGGHVTVTASASTTIVVDVIEIANVPSRSVVGTSAVQYQSYVGAPGTSTTPATPAPAATTYGLSLFVESVHWDSSATLTPPAGFTQDPLRTSAVSGAVASSQSGYQQATAAGTVIAAPSATLSASSTWAMFTVTVTAQLWSNYNAVVGDIIMADTTYGNGTITLPSSPASGATIEYKKVSTDNNLLTVGGGGHNIDGASFYYLNTPMVAGELMYDGTTSFTQWRIIGASGGTPSGVIESYAGVAIPGGWLGCDGSGYSRSTYPNLFNALNLSFSANTHTTTTIDGISTTVTSQLQPGWFISGSGIPAGSTIATVSSGSITITPNPTTSTLTGTTVVAGPYGIGDGSTTFNVPDLRGKVGIGAGQGSGLTSRVLGATGGEETHVLTTGELAVHAHLNTLTDPGHAHVTDWATAAGSTRHYMPESNGTLAGQTTGDPVLSGTSGVTITNANAGTGTAHNNMEPFMVVSFIIKL